MELPIKLPNNIMANLPAVPLNRLITILQENNDLITSIQDVLDTLKKINNNIIETMKHTLPDNMSKVSTGTPNCKTCSYYLPLIYGEEGCNRCLLQSGLITSEIQVTKCTSYLKFSDGNKGAYTMKQLSSILNISESDVASICWLYNIGSSSDNMWGREEEMYNKLLKFHFNNRALLVIYHINLWGEWRIHQFFNKYNERYKYVKSIKDNFDLQALLSNPTEILPKPQEENNIDEVSPTRARAKGSSKSKGKEDTTKGDIQTNKGDSSDKRESKRRPRNNTRTPKNK